MKRRLLLILSAVMLLAALCTAGALAEGETEYEVGSPEDWEKAISQITSSDETSATIVLTGDVNIGTAPVGVDGADIYTRTKPIRPCGASRRTVSIRQ